MHWHTASGGQKTAVQFKRSTNAFVTGTHEPGGEISHVNGICRIIRLACWWGCNGRQESIAKRTKLGIKSRSIRKREGENTTTRSGAHKKLEGPRAQRG